MCCLSAFNLITPGDIYWVTSLSKCLKAYDTPGDFLETFYHIKQSAVWIIGIFWVFSTFLMYNEVKELAPIHAFLDAPWIWRQAICCLLYSSSSVWWTCKGRSQQLAHQTQGVKRPSMGPALKCKCLLINMQSTAALPAKLWQFLQMEQIYISHFRVIFIHFTLRATSFSCFSRKW